MLEPVADPPSLSGLPAAPNPPSPPPATPGSRPGVSPRGAAGVTPGGAPVPASARPPEAPWELPGSTLGLVEALAAEPRRLLDGAESSTWYTWALPRLVGVTALSGAALGVAAGSFHSGPQWLYAGVKMPFVLLVPALLAMPALRGLAGLLGVELSWRRAAFAAALVAARIGLLGAALAPPYWLLHSADGRYRVAVLGLVLALGLAGLSGMRLLAAAPLWAPGEGLVRRGTWVLGVGGLFVALAGQTGWHLRPFVLRPSFPVVFLQAPDEDVFSALERRLEGRPDPGEVTLPFIYSL